MAEYVLRFGMPPEELVREWKHLTLAQVYGALAFCYDHRAAIDKGIRRQERALRKGAQNTLDVSSLPCFLRRLGLSEPRSRVGAS